MGHERRATMQEACEKYRGAVIALVDAIAEALGIDRLVEWLSRRMGGKGV